MVKKINKDSFNDIPGSEKFGKDNLLLFENKKDRTKRKDNYAFINRKGKTVNIDLTPYSQVKSFSNGFAVVKDKITRKYGFINTKGKLVIPTKYEDADHFMGGTALVEKNDNEFLINESGKIIFTFPDNIIHPYN